MNGTLLKLMYGAMLATFLACKPAGIESRIMESGGDPATWRATTTLNLYGEIKIERTQSGTADSSTTNRFNRVDLQAATSPDGHLSDGRLTAQKWIVLAEGTQDLTFNVLLTTTAANCYVNGSRLNGTNEGVY